MGKNISKETKNYIFFGVALALTILFIGLTLGLALRPYSTIMPYMCKCDDGTMVKGFLENNTIKVVVKDQDPQVVQYDYENATNDNVTAFKVKHVYASVNGSYISMEMRNIGNFVCVFLFAFFSVFGIGATCYTGLTAFKKK